MAEGVRIRDGKRSREDFEGIATGSFFKKCNDELCIKTGHENAFNLEDESSENFGEEEQVNPVSVDINIF